MSNLTSAEREICHALYGEFAASIGKHLTPAEDAGMDTTKVLFATLGATLSWCLQTYEVPARHLLVDEFAKSAHEIVELRRPT
jgi:hypothetical protein